MERWSVSTRTSGLPPAPRTGTQPVSVPAASHGALATRPGFGFDKIAVVPAQGGPEKRAIAEGPERLEREADEAADRVLRTSLPVPPAPPELPAEGADSHGDDARPVVASSGGRAPEGAPALVQEVLRSPGEPLDETTRAFFEPRLGMQLGNVRVHADARAAASATSVDALAYTVGENIVFGEARYSPGSGAGQRLLAHELAHVVQQAAPRGPTGRASPGFDFARLPIFGAPPLAAATPVLQREDGPPASTLGPGSHFELRIEAGDVSGNWRDEIQGDFSLDAQGQLTLPQLFTLELRLAPQQAAEAIAARLLDGYLRYPRVTLIAGGRTYTATPVVDEATQARDRAYAGFVTFIEGHEEPLVAVMRYQDWLDEHRDSDELLAMTPAQLWERSLREAEPTPRDRQFQTYQDLVQGELESIRGLPPEAAMPRLDAVERFQQWFERQTSEPGFEALDLPAELARFSVQAMVQGAAVPPRAGPVAPSLDVDAQMRHFDRYMLLALVLRGDHPISTYRRVIEAADAGRVQVFEAALGLGENPRAGPRVIPLDAQGADLLIHGDPARRLALGLLAEALMRWAGDHLTDPDFTRQDPLGVAVSLLEEERFGELFAWANAQPLDVEYIDRHEILADRALLSFGSTVLMGLGLVALVGLAVGAGIVTGGVATGIMLTLAAGAGVSAYLERREQVEATGYEVPIPETVLYSIGDVVGLSQLIEGISGQRLGTGEQLGSVERSEQLGEGAGGVTTLLLGSRAYRGGFARGRAFVSTRGRVPAGPYGSADPQIPDVQPPTRPVPNPTPGPNEARIRASLTPDEQVGLDLFIERIRSGRRAVDVETSLGRMGDDIARGHARTAAARFAEQNQRFARTQSMRERLFDDPLHPRLAHEERMGEVTVHYENTIPDEVPQAQALARATGREVHVFGDTPSGVDYPGIDGTIDAPARALSLKEAAPNWARTVAEDARALAQAHGYSQVTVHIQVRGGTIAEALAAWDSPSARDGNPLGALFGDGVVFEVILQDASGIHVVAPTAGPMVPPVLDQGRSEDTGGPR